MGWDSLLKIINREDQSIMSDAKRIQSEIHHITSNTVYTVKEGNQSGQYEILDTESLETFQVTLESKGNGKATYKGLPQKLKAFLFNYSESDIYENPAEVLDCLITMLNAKGECNDSLDLIDEGVLKKIMEVKTVFR